MDKEIFLNLLKERILILDGGMGTMVQGFKLTEKDYRGKQFADWTSDLKGNNDLLCITRPDVIKSIHRQYLDAGADIFATNTFNANAISMEDYGMQGQVRNINLAAGKLAREVADGFMKEHPDRTIFVAGSVGPTNKTASMSPDVSDPAYRAVTYLDLYSAYKEQVDALVDGGVDIVLFETTFDTLNVKAGLEAAEAVLKEKGKDLPIMLSLTLSAQGGRTFSGQTLLAFLASVQHTNIVSVGLNCSFGAADMKPFLAELAKHAPYYISAYPNAGLPNSFGSYDETPEKMAVHVKSFIDEGLVNILGGCCGTTPAHIAKYPELVLQVCAGGGARVNYGLLPYFNEFWTSDDTDALQRIYMQWGVSNFYPAIAMASHVSADKNHQTGRILPLKFRFDVAMSGRLGMEIQPKDMKEEDKEFAKRAIAAYKGIRPVVQLGDLYRLVSPYDNKGVASLMYATPEKDRAVFFAYKISHFINMIVPNVRMSGLDAQKRYRIKDLTAVKTNEPCALHGKVISGKILMEEGIALKNLLKSEYSSLTLELEEVK